MGRGHLLYPVELRGLRDHSTPGKILAGHQVKLTIWFVASEPNLLNYGPWRIIKHIISRMLRPRKNALAMALVLSVVVFWLFPVGWLAAPEWEVVVIDEQGKPVEGMTVRETWQNYSVETEEHEADRKTDANGRATFPARRPEYSVLRQIVGTASALVHLNVHASYGPHATVFAFGKGLEGAATTGNFVTDWTGSPSSMQSRIVVRPMILPTQP